MKRILILILIIPVIGFAQFSKSLEEMKNDEKPVYQKYEDLLFSATQYIFSNPVDTSSREFLASTQIVGFWMNKDTGMGIPTFGNFFEGLTNKNNQQFLYTIAMIHYGLGQKLNHNRILKCIPVTGQNYEEREDVKEVQYEGAKILLEYISNKKNNVPVNSKTKKFIKAYKKGKLDEIFFNK